MGEWSAYGICNDCDQGTCGRCKKYRTKEVVQDCLNGGNCKCERQTEEAECSKPCRKQII